MLARLDKFDIRLALLAVVATACFAFYIYNMDRTWDEYLGFAPGLALNSLLLTFVVTVLLTTVGGSLLIGFPLLAAYKQAEFRQRRGHCLHCDYSLHGLRSNVCPECGEPIPADSHEHPGRSHDRRLHRCLVIVTLGMVLSTIAGSSVAEGFILLDEQRFLAEVDVHRRTNTPGNYARSRAWPNGNCSLVYIDGKGVHATE